MGGFFPDEYPYVIIFTRIYMQQDYKKMKNRSIVERTTNLCQRLAAEQVIYIFGEH